MSSKLLGPDSANESWPTEVWVWEYDGFKSGWDADPEEAPPQPIDTFGLMFMRNKPRASRNLKR